MNSAIFNQMLHEWTPAELQQKYLEIKEELKVKLANICLCGASIGCVMFHLEKADNKNTAMQIINDLRTYCNDFADIQSQLKCIRLQLKNKGIDLKGV